MEMQTLSETITMLRDRGYVEDFNLKTDCIECKNLRLTPSEFVIDKTYRFEGQTDPADEAIIYAISAKDNRTKGILVNGYGIYSDPITDDMLRKLSGK